MADKMKSVKDIMLPHSAAKVEFYEKYLEKYIAIMNVSQWHDSIHIYDVFCGRGIYEDGGLGSLVIAVRTILKVKKECPSNTKFHFNDIDKKNTEKVIEYIDKNFPDFRKYCTIYATNNDAEGWLDNLSKDLITTDKNERNLMFIDPYGYKNIHKETIYRLMSNGRTEILLFLPISFMYRFRHYAFEEDCVEGAKRLREFIAAFFPMDHPVITEEEMDVKTYIRHLSKAFSYDNTFYSTSYHIERNENNYFALFFICSNILGFQKILEVKWEMDKTDGNGFQQPSQTLDLFSDWNKQERQRELFDWLKKSLIKYLSKKRKSSEVYEQVMRWGFLPSHAVKILKDLQNSNRLDVIDLNGNIARKGAFYLKYDEYKKTSHFIRLKNENN